MNEDFKEFLNFTKQHLNVSDDLVQDYEEQLRQIYGGDQIRIPKNRDLGKRDILIKQAYNGRNAKELAKQYGLSVSRVYDIVS